MAELCPLEGALGDGGDGGGARRERERVLFSSLPWERRAPDLSEVTTL